MITEEEFVAKVEDAFEIEERGVLTADMNYKDFDEWSSMRALILIALIDTEFDLLISGSDLKEFNTLGEIYSAIVERKK